MEQPPFWARTSSRPNTPAQAGVFLVVAVLAVSVGTFLSGWLAPSAEALTATPRLELTADPGATVLASIRITNEERRSQVFYSSFENFNSQDESGTPSFSPRREGLAAWMKAPAQIVLGPGQTEDIPLEITIPQDADPGGHFAAVFFSTEPPQTRENEGNVSIGARLGTLVLLRVNGDFDQSATIAEFNTASKQKLFSSLPVQFYYRFQNTGDDHQKPLGDIQITNMLGRTVKLLPANTLDGSVLPKSIRRFTSVWTESGGMQQQEPVTDLPELQDLTFWQTVAAQWKNFNFGRYTATLKLVYGTKELQSVRSQTSFYIIPWQLLSIAVPSGIVLLVLLRFGIKRYNRYIIAKAKK